MVPSTQPYIISHNSSFRCGHRVHRCHKKHFPTSIMHLLGPRHLQLPPPTTWQRRVDSSSMPPNVVKSGDTVDYCGPPATQNPGTERALQHINNIQRTRKRPLKETHMYGGKRKKKHNIYPPTCSHILYIYTIYEKTSRLWVLFCKISLCCSLNCLVHVLLPFKLHY